MSVWQVQSVTNVEQLYYDSRGDCYEIHDGEGNVKCAFSLLVGDESDIQRAINDAIGKYLQNQARSLKDIHLDLMSAYSDLLDKIEEIAIYSTKPHIFFSATGDQIAEMLDELLDYIDPTLHEDG
jgi:hypothetical protein